MRHVTFGTMLTELLLIYGADRHLMWELCLELSSTGGGGGGVCWSHSNGLFPAAESLL